MVSAKFHIVGSTNDWLRVRLQEELYAHGLDGGVLVADQNTMAVVIEGDKSKIKRLYTDIQEFLPAETQVTEVVFSLTKPTRSGRIHVAEEGRLPLTRDEIIQYLTEIDRKTSKIDQKLNKIIAMLETANANTANGETKTEEPSDKDPEVSDEATNVFARMFGE